MARALWSGSISFGLVNIPVKLYTAVREQAVHFAMLSPEGDCRLRRKLVCPDTGEEVDFSKTARGYEIAPGQFVLVKDEEIDKLKPEQGRMLEIEDFVDLERVDPVYYNRTYHLLPDERGGKAYRLLLEAMKKTGKAAVGRFVMRQKQYLAILRPFSDDRIALQTMYFADEVVQVEEVGEPPRGDVDARELKVAEQLIGALAGEFEPDKYKDEYREALLKLVEEKAQGGSVSLAESEAPSDEPRVFSLMEALEQSLKGTKKAEPDKKTPRRRKSA